MELVTFKMIVDIGISLFNVTKSLTGKEKRENVGHWMKDLGILVEEIARQLEQGQYPHSSCAKMSYMVDHFKDVMSDHLDDKELNDLHEMLHQAKNIERLYAEVNQLPERDRIEKIIALKEIGGTLQAAGEMLIL